MQGVCVTRHEYNHEIEVIIVVVFTYEICPRVVDCVVLEKEHQNMK